MKTHECTASVLVSSSAAKAVTLASSFLNLQRSRSRYFLHWLLAAALLAFCCAPLWAQTGGSTIVGTVTDPTGAAIVGATVTVTNVATGVSRNYTTNSDGNYQATQLEVGRYNVTVKNAGFKTYEQSGVNVDVSATVRADASLQLGQASESVTVSAEAVQVQSESNEQSNLITGTQIANLATNGRNVIGLATLGTGVSSGLPSFNLPTSVTADNNISFNGQRPAHNVWLIDGGENYDRGSGGKISTMPSQDAISEFRVLTSNYSADYGFASGGTVSMILKSGTRDFHAQLWEFFRNDDLDANNYIANLNSQPIPKLRYNVYGWNLGGPIYIPGHYNRDRNKTFFFWNEEWRSDIQGSQSNTINDPTVTQRGGLFPSTTPIYVPQTTDPVMQARYAAAGVTAGAPFPQNAAGQYVIPASLINPQASALLGAGIFPNPTSFSSTGAGQYSSAPAEPLKLHEELIRVDHNFTDKLALSTHFIDDMTNQNFATTLWNSTNVPTVGTLLHTPSYAAIANLTYLISPTAVNELSLQYDGNRLLIAPTGLISSSSVNIPQYFPGDNLNRLPNIQVAGNYGINYGPYWQPWYNAYNAYQIGDNVSITKGAHNMKFGANGMWFTKAQDGFTNTEGTFNFNGSATALSPAYLATHPNAAPSNGDAFADFLLGDANNYAEAQAQPRIHTAATGFGLYALDNWHVNSKLTLNLGLRYEGIPQTRVVDNGVSNFYPNLYNYNNAPTFTSSGALNPYNSSGGLANGFLLVPGTNIPYYANGLGTTGQPGIPRQFVQNHWNNWAPRVGFAYDVGGNGKTVIRSGFGIFYERIQGNDLYNMIGNPPFATTPSANNVYLNNPNVSYTSGVTAATPVFPAAIGQALCSTCFKLPNSLEWSFNIQQQLAANTVLSVAYVGNENVHQPIQVNINTPPPSYQAAVASGAISSGANNQPFNIYPGFSNIANVENVTNSNYNSLQVALTVRDWHGLTVNLGYTWSHELDYTTGEFNGGNINGQTNDAQGNLVTDPFNFKLDYGSGDFDRRQIFTLAYVYELPFFRHSDNGFLKNVAGGWVFSGVTMAETGFPITVYSSTGNTAGLGTNQVQNHAEVVAPVTIPGTFAQWFTGSSLADPPAGTFGDLGRGAIRGPGRQNWDFSLLKKFGLGFREGANLEFRADAFNAFNHTQFDQVGATIGQGTLGQVTSVYDPRVLQLGLTLSF